MIGVDVRHRYGTTGDVIVRCHGLDCHQTHTLQMLAGETDAAARRRAVASALAGRWVKRRYYIWCGNCARRLLLSP